MQKRTNVAKKTKKTKKTKERFTTSDWTLKKPMYLKKNDERYNKHVRDLKKYGFSNAETWCLRSVIAKFILPRLKRFRDISIAHPGNMTQEQWIEILNKMIFAFEWTIIEDEEYSWSRPKEETNQNWKKYEEGMELFSKWFMGLWW